MQGLSAYQTVIREALRELEPLAARYGAEDSSLGRGEAAKLAQTYRQAREHCDERLEADRPRVMLYGVYNAGKSTLLNALLGREEAAIGDTPTTARLSSYLWNGYELLDTPGINAPIEHEIISREALTRCQVVFFVVSAANSFENMAIFEAMRDVARQGKRLFIVLNDKENKGADHPDMTRVRQAVQRNLMAVGFDAEQAAAFRLCVINAKFALLGRLHRNDKLVESSGILELERLAVEEIRRVNGFALAADLCGYLHASFAPLAGQLARIDEGGDAVSRNDFLQARREYAEFRAALEGKIRNECASLERAFMGCFPSLETVTAASVGMDAESVGDGIRQAWDRRGEAVDQLVREEIERYRHRLAAQLRHILTSPSVAVPPAAGAPDGQTLESIRNTLEHRPRPAEPAAPSVSGNELCDKVEAVGSILGGTTLATAVLKIPLPVLGPLSIPAGLALTILPRIFRALFGKSQAELENERIEAVAAERRRVEEENARNIALWRQELRHYCQDLTQDFLRAAKERASAMLEAAFAGVFADAEAEMLAREASGREILADAARLQTILERLSRAEEDLRAREASL